MIFFFVDLEADTISSVVYPLAKETITCSSSSVNKDEDVSSCVGLEASSLTPSGIVV